MNEYLVSARKYRPDSFTDVVGQKNLTTTLMHAVKNGKLAHAYLFCGPRGVGKTTCARIFAKTINCMTPQNEEPCNHCESCVAFNSQRSYNILELDAASNNSVENIKTLMEQTRIPPQIGKYKVFIIDEVHMLSTAAFNAFLKTLEEPPAHVIFILATTEKNKILPTILSRCQIYDFERMSTPMITDHLKMVAQKEGIKFEEEALRLIAEKADGGMRDALSIFDQAAGYCQGDITYEKILEDLNVLDTENFFTLTELALQNKTMECMLLVDQLLSKGFDGHHLVMGLASHLRNLLMAKNPKTINLIDTTQKQKDLYLRQAQVCESKFVYKAIKICNDYDINYRQSSNKRLHLELTIIQISQITQDESDETSSGQSPETLKSLFTKKAEASESSTVRQVTDMPEPKPNASRSGNIAHNEKTINHGNNSEVMSDQEDKKIGKAPKLNLQNIGMTFGQLRSDKATSTPKDIKSQTPQDPSEEKSSTNNSFDQQTLQSAWIALCDQIPQNMRGMAMRLKKITPRLIAFPEIEFVAENELFMDQLKQMRNGIAQRLQKIIGCDALQIEIRLAETHEVKYIKSKKQIYDEMKESNAAISQLTQTFDLELT